MTTINPAIFRLGRCSITEAAKSYLDECSIKPEHLLRRHASGDWGDIPDSDAMLNTEAAKSGGRILSVYVVLGNIVYVITVQEPEHERRTVIVLPGED